MTMEQLFVRLLYEDWAPQAYSIRQIEKEENAIKIKGSYDWFHDLEKYCEKIERETIPAEDILLENGVLLMKKRTVPEIQTAFRRKCVEGIYFRGIQRFSQGSDRKWKGNSQSRRFI